MIYEILKFVEGFKNRKAFYTITENSDKIRESLDYISKRAKKWFFTKWGVELPDNQLEFSRLSGLQLDWEITVDNVYIYGGFYNHGYNISISKNADSDYLCLACEHRNFNEKQELFLKENTNWFTKSAHGSGEGTYGIFYRTKEKFPFDILYLDNGIYFKTNFTTESYYQALIDSMAICGWQYFYIDFEEIKKQCGNIKVGQRWLTVYPYSDGMSESPLGRNVTQETSRLDALVHHMEKCVYLLPKIFPEKDFNYHAKRLSDFKEFLR